jgi:hypothetical protein
MNTGLHTSLSDHPVYRKALEIFNMSSHISSYLSQDMAGSGPNGLESDLIYVSGDIVQQSFNLGPAIIKAERQKHSEAKYKHLESLDRLTFRLIKSCKRLERANSNGRDFLPLLKTEVKKFRRLQRHWMLTL